MTGAREGKPDGNKHQDSGQALFPRLHVAETKRTGPRGPPRNIMALYEQLTIPSHKFKPSPMPLPSSSGRPVKSPAMTTSLYLPIPQVPAVSHESMYSYLSMGYMNHTMMPTLACVPSYSYSGLLSADAVSSMNSSGNVTDSGVEATSVGGTAAGSSRQLKYPTPTRKGRGDDDFAVPTYSSITQSSGQSARPSSPVQMQKAPRGQRPFSRIKEPAMQKRSPLTKDKSLEVTSLSHKDDGRWSTASECVTVSVDIDSRLERMPTADSFPATAPRTDRVRRVDSLTAPSERDVFSTISTESSEPSLQRRGTSAETGSSIMDDVPTGSIQFEDVVNAFGQQEFWKTQMIMIRQQRIFSRQVFELHRVIKVQHLLAKTLCTAISIDEALEKEDDNVHMADSPIAEVPEVPQAESPVAEVPEVPVIAEAPQVPEASERRPETKVTIESAKPSLDTFTRPVYPLPVPKQHVVNSEPQWQPPPYAPSPWAVRMASPFMYVPYPGGYGPYPMMGAPMPMYAQPGAQPVQFPTWQQPGMSPLMGVPDSSAMAAWYGQHVAPQPAAVAANVRQRERLTASGSGQSVESTSYSQPGQDVERSGIPHTRSSVEPEGLRRREGRWIRGDRSLVQQKTSDVADLRGNEAAECQHGGNTIASERGTIDTGEVEGTNPESSSLKHNRTESAFEPGVCRWFPILSPAKRPMHHNGVIKVVPRAASATPELAANILLSIQTDRRT